MRAGAFLGPDSFRRFLSPALHIGPLHNAESGIDVEKGLASISDYGNIQVDQVVEIGKPILPDDMRQLYEKLALKSKLCV